MLRFPSRRVPPSAWPHCHCGVEFAGYILHSQLSFSQRSKAYSLSTCKIQLDASFLTFCMQRPRCFRQEGACYAEPGYVGPEAISNHDSSARTHMCASVCESVKGSVCDCETVARCPVELSIGVFVKATLFSRCPIFPRSANGVD